VGLKLGPEALGQDQLTPQRIPSKQPICCGNSWSATAWLGFRHCGGRSSRPRLLREGSRARLCDSQGYREPSSRRLDCRDGARDHLLASQPGSTDKT
jgi:hypothetical protein